MKTIQDAKIYYLVAFCCSLSYYAVAKAVLSTKNDWSRRIGVVVSAKAKRVTSEAECCYLFGSLRKSQWGAGIIMQVVTPKVGSNNQPLIICDWFVDDVTKPRRVKIMSVPLATWSKNGLAFLQPVRLTSSRLPLAALLVVNCQNMDIKWSALSRSVRPKQFWYFDLSIAIHRIRDQHSSDLLLKCKLRIWLKRSGGKSSKWWFSFTLVRNGELKVKFHNPFMAVLYIGASVVLILQGYTALHCFNCICETYLSSLYLH